LQREQSSLQFLPSAAVTAEQAPGPPVHCPQVPHSVVSPAPRVWQLPETHCEQLLVQPLPSVAVTVLHAPLPPVHCSQVPHSAVSPLPRVTQVPVSQ